MSQQNETVRVETTVDSKEGAERLATLVVDGRLAACAQVSGPISSFYRWEGEVQSDDEWIVVIKTAADRLPTLTERIVEAHPYDVPEIVAVPAIGGNQTSLVWTRGDGRADTADGVEP